jgi:hypothetical protein
LPGVTEAKYWPGDYPRCNDANGKDEHSWPTAEVRRRLRKSGVTKRCYAYWSSLWAPKRLIK